jgi:hypothetical protein
MHRNQQVSGYEGAPHGTGIAHAGSEEPMEAVSMQPRVAPRIRPPPSQLRHLWQVAIVAVVAAVLAFFVMRYFRREDATHLRQLAQFSSAYTSECDAFGFNAPFPPVVRDAYLHSHALQQVVVRETAALAAGASCDQVTQALHAADFPAPLPARLPAIHLRPDQ